MSRMSRTTVIAEKKFHECHSKCRSKQFQINRKLVTVFRGTLEGILF